MKIMKKIFGTFDFKIVKKSDYNSLMRFSNLLYNRYNQRVQEHLASLHLDLINKSVLELGAGIGDHTSFWIDRKCSVTITEAREENLNIISSRYKNQTIKQLNLDNLKNVTLDKKYDIVYFYGVLHHLKNPEEAIKFISKYCKSLLLLESCVSYGVEEKIHFVKEPKDDPTQSFTGIGCRPTRAWIFRQLKNHFNYVYMPITQPAYPDFPLDWTKKTKSSSARAIFIASRYKLSNDLLVDFLPDKQYIDIKEYYSKQ